MGFLFWFGSVPPVSGLFVLAFTWLSFASKSLMTRLAIVGDHPAAFWAIIIPFILASLVLPTVAGVNYYYYWISMRMAFSVWSALCIILGCFCGYYGYQTISKLKKSGNDFHYKQQLRVLIFIVGICIGCGIPLGFQAYFLENIDNFWQIWILCMAVYRMAGIGGAIGCAIYVWYATIHHQVAGNSSSLKSTRASTRQSEKTPSGESIERPSKNTSTSSSSEETVENDDSV